MKTALVIGATGLIGKQLLETLLTDDYYHSVKTLSRKPINIVHPRHQNNIIDFDNVGQYRESMSADDVFCCLGTTMNQAKTKEAFRKVDLTYPYEIAEITKDLGAHQYLLVSALGADKTSSIYYNKIKGETEALITSVGFETLHIFRPSLLLGERAESRPGEDSAKLLYKAFSWLIPARYKGIDAGRVARAMNACAKEHKPGVSIHESLSLQKF